MFIKFFRSRKLGRELEKRSAVGGVTIGNEIKGSISKRNWDVNRKFSHRFPMIKTADRWSRPPRARYNRKLSLENSWNNQTNSFARSIAFTRCLKPGNNLNGLAFNRCWPGHLETFSWLSNVDFIQIARGATVDVNKISTEFQMINNFEKSARWTKPGEYYRNANEISRQ